MFNRPTLFDTKEQFRRAPLYFLGVIVFAFFPIIVAMLATFISKLTDCQVNEAGTGTCGYALDLMVTSGWFALLTVPLGLVAFITLTIVTIHDYIFHHVKGN